MIPARAFEIDSQSYSIHRLLPEDSSSIQSLYDDCLDFMLLVDGRPARADAAEELFHDVPPSVPPENKFIFGIFDLQASLVGLLETLQGYPDQTTWWIDLLLLEPQARSRGVGKQVVEGFIEHVKACGWQMVMLGVVEENQRAYTFWSRVGFEFVRKTEPRQFGNKTQAVSVMRRVL